MMFAISLAKASQNRDMLERIGNCFLRSGSLQNGLHFFHIIERVPPLDLLLHCAHVSENKGCIQDTIAAYKLILSRMLVEPKSPGSQAGLPSALVNAPSRS